MSILIKWLESLNMEIEITHRCLREVSPFSQCSACIATCPNQALKWDGERIAIVSQNCDDCGACIPACPVQAIEGQSPKRQTIGTSLLLDQGPPATINELLFFYHAGFRNVLLDVQKTPIETLEAVNDLLERMGMEPFMIEKERELIESEHADMPLSRRAFLHNLSSKGKKAVLRHATPAKWRVNQDQFRVNAYFPGWTFYQIELDRHRCTLCEACFKLCPVAAFHLTEDNLEVEEEKCLGCQLCTDICHHNAIHIVDNIKKSASFKAEVSKLTCCRCKSTFHSWEHTDLCPVCKSAEEKKKTLFL